MSQVNIPDPLEVQIKALDEAFYEWYDNADNSMDLHYWTERWNQSAHEPFVYTADEIYEGWGNEIEEFHETHTLVVDKALQEEIERKTSILQEINENE